MHDRRSLETLRTVGDSVADGDRRSPPLALYVHIPWCLRKCPYCDFNSHALGGGSPWAGYVGRLLLDLEQELRDPAARRPLASIFIGGGTPSLLPGESARALLAGIRDRTDLTADCEVTLEANPGTVDSRRFAAYRSAGVNRLSIGVQSLDDRSLGRLSRIHNSAGARSAVVSARSAGFENLNLDMMFGLPGQGLEQAQADLEALISLGPEHVSYYQLTLEPDTVFGAAPPPLPDCDLAAEMAAAGRERLEAAGYRQYEVSAYAQPGRSCRHNLNYWRFGDYLGIGAGAHGKLTDALGRVRRRVKHERPADYLNARPESLASEERCLDESDLRFEFALNAFRLTDGFELALFERTTGLPPSRLASELAAAQRDGLLDLEGDMVRPTELGRSFVDDLVGRLLPGADRPAQSAQDAIANAGATVASRAAQ